MTPRYGGGLAVAKDNLVLYMGGINCGSTSQSNHGNKPPTRHVGVGVIKNKIFTVSYIYIIYITYYIISNFCYK